MKVCLIGYGARGKLYANLFSSLGAKITAVCDVNKERLIEAQKSFDLEPAMLFENSKDFFNQEKMADLCIVATQDLQHKEHALPAMELGYDLLLEKPIATNINDCIDIQETANKLNRKIFVCHVLRYAPFFATIKKELNSGSYGRISTINLTENVGFWHQAHSYVRGNWRKNESSSPMLIAKCCHDLDLISWFIDKKCTAVSSFGSLSFYTSKNAPIDSAERCLDCNVKDECIYDAEKFYILDRFDIGHTVWPVNILARTPTRENLYDALRETNYGRCVFKMDNDVVDHQIVNMEFEDRITAHLTMTAFSKDCYREIHVHCERGEIYGSMKDNILHCNIFGKESKEINLSNIEDNQYGHGGGDINMIRDIINYYKKTFTDSLTDIDQSMQSHIIGFAAEESRLDKSKVIHLAQK